MSLDKKLLEIISLTWAYYNRGQSLQDQVLLMYAEDLSDLDLDQVCIAYGEWRRNPKNKTFPLPAQIRELVCPEQNIAPEAMAREIAARITGAVPKYGWNNGKEAALFIGPAGWSAVERAGGWLYICENLGTKLSATTFQAQIRDQIEANLRYGGALEQAIAIAPTRKHGGLGLSSASDVIKKITGDYEPEEGA